MVTKVSMVVALMLLIFLVYANMSGMEIDDPGIKFSIPRWRIWYILATKPQLMQYPPGSRKMAIAMLYAHSKGLLPANAQRIE